MDEYIDKNATVGILEAMSRSADCECIKKRFPVRKGTVVYVHPKGRYIVTECGGVRETFFPEEVLV